MKNCLIINESNREIKAFQSKWEREIGEVVRIDGEKWKVVYLHEDLSSIKHYIYTFRSRLFNTYCFETIKKF
jgi:hypothetical protein